MKQSAFCELASLDDLRRIAEDFDWSDAFCKGAHVVSPAIFERESRGVQSIDYPPVLIIDLVDQSSANPLLTIVGIGVQSFGINFGHVLDPALSTQSHGTFTLRLTCGGPAIIACRFLARRGDAAWLEKLQVSAWLSRVRFSDPINFEVDGQTISNC